MLDVKYVIDNLEEVIERLSTRTGDYSYLRQLPALEEKRKELILKADRLKAERNSQSKEIGKLKAQKKEEEAKALMEKINFDKDEIARLDKERAGVEDEIHEIMLKTPNIPDKSLPVGTDDSFNRPEKYWGDPTVFRFKPKAGSEEAAGHQNHEKTYKNRRFCHLSTSGKIFAEKSKRVYLIAQRVIFH